MRAPGDKILAAIGEQADLPVGTASASGSSCSPLRRGCAHGRAQLRTPLVQLSFQQARRLSQYAAGLVELDYAMLADSAQVADGKTYVLGGGVSILYRSQFPAPLGVTLVMQLTYERTEADSDHQIRIVVMDADGNPILPEIQGEIHLGPPREGMPRGVPLVAPMIIGFPPIPVVQRVGEYAVDILVDGRHLKRLPFAVTLPPQQPPSA